MSTVYELINDAKIKSRNSRPAAFKPSEAELLDNLGELVVIKPLVYDGKEYRRGEPITLAGFANDAALCRAGYFTPKAIYESGAAHSQHAALLRSIEPLEARLLALDTEVSRGEAALAAAQLAVKNARSKLSTHKQNRAAVEKQLLEMLSPQVVG